MINEHKITTELLMSWAKDYYLVRKRDIILFVLWSIVGICGLLLLMPLVVFGGDSIDWVLAILFIFFAIYKGFWAGFPAPGGWFT